MRKPTPKMMAILEKLAQPGSFAHYMGYMGRFNPTPYYFLHISMDRCTIEIRGLVSRGLAERFNEDEFGDHEVRISKLGRKYLRECKAESK